MFSLALGVALFLYNAWFLPETTQPDAYETAPSTQEDSTASIIRITRVIDGDTVKVMYEGEEVTIRVIGINTPETVDPRKSVECFGAEASHATQAFLREGSRVILTADSTQDDQDKYGRLLRYITNEYGEDLGLYLISSGYAYEYTYKVPYERQVEYRAAQQEAEQISAGLWGAQCATNSSAP